MMTVSDEQLADLLDKINELRDRMRCLERTLNEVLLRLGFQNHGPTKPENDDHD